MSVVKRKRAEAVNAKESLATAKIMGEVRPSEPEDAESDRKKKKARTTFTGRQIFELEKQFEVKKYLSSSERADMAKLLNVTETQVSHDKYSYHIVHPLEKRQSWKLQLQIP